MKALPIRSAHRIDYIAGCFFAHFRAHKFSAMLQRYAELREIIDITVDGRAWPRTVAAIRAALDEPSLMP